MCMRDLEIAPCRTGERSAGGTRPVARPRRARRLRSWRGTPDGGIPGRRTGQFLTIELPGYLSGLREASFSAAVELVGGPRSQPGGGKDRAAWAPSDRAADRAFGGAAACRGPRAGRSVRWRRRPRSFGRRVAARGGAAAPEAGRLRLGVAPRVRGRGDAWSASRRPAARARTPAPGVGKPGRGREGSTERSRPDRATTREKRPRYGVGPVPRPSPAW